MGIRELRQFLDAHNLIEYIHLPSKYRHQVLLCDIASTLFRYRTTSETDAKFMAKVQSFLISFLMAEVHVVFIFDGKAPPDKDEEQRDRAEQRERTEDRLEGLNQLIKDLTLTDKQLRQGVADLNMRIKEIDGEESKAEFEVAERKVEFLTEAVQFLAEGVATAVSDPALIDQVANRLPEGTSESALRTTLRMVYDKRVTRNVKLERHHFQMVQQFMTDYGIPWIQAPGEAEAFACYLIEHHSEWFAPALLTEDSDALTYGAPYWLSDYQPKDGTCSSISLAQALDQLNFKSFEQWRDFNILCECDYNHRLPGYGPVKLYKQWIEAERTLEEFLIFTATTTTGEQLAALRTERCRTLFEHFGQDSVEMREQVLGKCFREWLAARPLGAPYWDLSREDELTRVLVRDQSDVWGSSDGGGGRNENGRVAHNWVWPMGGALVM